MVAERLGALGALMFLAACQSSAPSGPAPAAQAPAPMVASSGPEQACTQKVAETAARPASDISIASNEETIGGYLIMLNVAGAAAPWRCSVDDRGIAEVEYVGEGLDRRSAASPDWR